MDIYNGKLVICVDNEHIFIGKIASFNETTNCCIMTDARLITPGEGVTVTLEGIVSMATDITVFKNFTEYMSSPVAVILIPNIRYIFVVDDVIKNTYTVATKSDKSIIKEQNEENKPNWARVNKVNKPVDWKTAGSFM